LLIRETCTESCAADREHVFNSRWRDMESVYIDWAGRGRWSNSAVSITVSCAAHVHDPTHHGAADGAVQGTLLPRPISIRDRIGKIVIISDAHVRDLNTRSEGRVCTDLIDPIHDFV